MKTTSPRKVLLLPRGAYFQLIAMQERVDRICASSGDFMLCRRSEIRPSSCCQTILATWIFTCLEPSAVHCMTLKMDFSSERVSLRIATISWVLCLCFTYQTVHDCTYKQRWAAFAIQKFTREYVITYYFSTQVHQCKVRALQASEIEREG